MERDVVSALVTHRSLDRTHLMVSPSGRGKHGERSLSRLGSQPGPILLVSSTHFCEHFDISHNIAAQNFPRNNIFRHIPTDYSGRGEV